MKTLEFIKNAFDSDTPYSILFKLLHKSKFTKSDWNSIANCLETLNKYTKSVPVKNQIGVSNFYDRYLKRIEKLVGIVIKQNTYEKLGIIKKDPFLLYKSSRVRKEVIFLTASKLKKLELHEFAKPILTFIKDLFIFCCYTGMPYREMCNLKKENLQAGFNGNTLIEMSRQKTGRTLSVPLLPKPSSIIEKYVSSESETIFPVISNQRFNIYLKEIAKALNISKRLTHHTARKTFVSTVLLYNDVSMEIVSELLSHSGLLITEQSYGKLLIRKLVKLWQW